MHKVNALLSLDILRRTIIPKFLFLSFIILTLFIPLVFADTGVEFGAEDDLTVNGTAGDNTDADLEVKGYSVFGNATGANIPLKVTTGAGSAFIKGDLEVKGVGYFDTNIGVGTTNPGYKLDIQGAGTAPIFRINAYILPGSTGTNGQVLQTNGSGVVSWGTVSGGSGSPGGSVNQLQYNYPSGTFGGTPLIVSDGNNLTVGIGTTNSNTRLYIRGADTGTGFTLRIANSTPADNMVVLDNGNVGIGMTVPTAKLEIKSATSNTAPYFTMRIRTSTGTETMAILDNGNVGIGQTNPSYKLHVTGGNIFDASGGTFGSLNVGTTQGQIDYSGPGTVVIGDNTSDAVTLQTSAGNDINFIVNATTNAMIIKSTGNVGVGNTAPAALLHVSTNPSTGLVVLANTNVGIRNTNPSYHLHVAGTAAAQTLRFGTNLNNILPAGTGANNQVLQTDGTGAINWGTVSGGSGSPGGSVNQLQYNYPSGTFGGTPLIVTDSGRLSIGIGTTANASTLYIKGTTATTFTLRVADSGANDRLAILQNGNVGIGTTNPTEALHVTGDIQIDGSEDSYFGGNLGLGITAPSYKLHVAGTAAAQTLRFGTNLDNIFPAGTGTSGQVLQASGTGAISWGTVSGGSGTPGGSVNQLQYNYPSGTFAGTPLIVSDGNNLTVGIGTTNSNTRLYVRGAGTGTGIALRIADSTPADRVVVLDNGNVGIGLTNPSYKLDIQGAGTAPVFRINGYILPGSTGSANQVLQTNGSGVVSWATGGGSGNPGGSNTQVQYNNNTAFGGAANLTYNNGTNATTIGGASDYTTISSSGAITYAGTAQPRRTIILTPGGAIVPASNAPQQLQTNGTNLSFYTLNYSGVAPSAESAYWEFVVPDSFSTSTTTLTATIYWLTPSTTTGNAVKWFIATNGFGDQATLDAALSSESTVTDNPSGTANQVLVTSEITAITSGWTAGELAVVKVKRDATDGSDTETDLAKLLMVKLEWTASAESDQ